MTLQAITSAAAGQIAPASADATLALLWERIRRQGDMPGFTRAINAILASMRGEEKIVGSTVASQTLSGTSTPLAPTQRARHERTEIWRGTSKLLQKRVSERHSAVLPSKCSPSNKESEPAHVAAYQLQDQFYRRRADRLHLDAASAQRRAAMGDA